MSVYTQHAYSLLLAYERNVCIVETQYISEIWDIYSVRTGDYKYPANGKVNLPTKEILSHSRLPNRHFISLDFDADYTDPRFALERVMQYLQ